MSGLATKTNFVSDGMSRAVEIVENFNADHPGDVSLAQCLGDMCRLHEQQELWVAERGGLLMRIGAHDITIRDLKLELEYAHKENESLEATNAELVEENARLKLEQREAQGLGVVKWQPQEQMQPEGLLLGGG